jgi:hypothetical protein
MLCACSDTDGECPVEIGRGKFWFGGNLAKAVTVIRALRQSRINERAISHRNCRCQSQTATRYRMARRPRSELELFNAPMNQDPEAEKVSRQIDEELRVRTACVFDLPGGLTPNYRRRRTG